MHVGLVFAGLAAITAAVPITADSNALYAKYTPYGSYTPYYRYGTAVEAAANMPHGTQPSRFQSSPSTIPLIHSYRN